MLKNRHVSARFTKYDLKWTKSKFLSLNIDHSHNLAIITIHVFLSIATVNPVVGK